MCAASKQASKQASKRERERDKEREKAGLGTTCIPNVKNNRALGSDSNILGLGGFKLAFMLTATASEA